MGLTLAQAFEALEIQHGSTLEEARLSYRKLALLNHPDKNQNSPESTAKFQHLSAAYDRIQAHHEAPPARTFSGGGGGGAAFAFGGGFSFGGGGRAPQFPSSSGFSFGGGGGMRSGMFGGARAGEGDPYDSEEDYDDDDEYEGDYTDTEEGSYDDEDDFDRAGFFYFMFEDILSGGYGSRQQYRQTRQPRSHVNESPAARTQRLKEEDEERRARSKKLMEEMEQSEERRKMEEVQEKEKREWEREQERLAGIARRDDKNARKRATAAAEKATAATRAQERLQAAQKKRSEVFAAARRGDAEAVKKGVYEDDIAADGGEWLAGMEPKEEDEPVQVKEVHEEAIKSPPSITQPAPTAAGKGKAKKGQDQQPKAPSVDADKENVQHPATPVKPPRTPQPQSQPQSTTAASSTAGDGQAKGNGGGAGKKSKKGKKKGGATANNGTSTTNTAVNSPSSSPAVPQAAFSAPADPPKPKPTSKKVLTDPKETLLHIAVKNGDTELVKWLCNHGSLPEERDSASFTAFHYALQLGHYDIVLYFLEEYPIPDSEPSEPDSTYPLPPAETLLTLAVTSGNADVVALVVDYADVEDVAGNWEWIDAWIDEVLEGGPEGKGRREGEERDRWEAVKWAMSAKEGFNAPEGYRRRRRPAGGR